MTNSTSKLSFKTDTNGNPNLNQDEDTVINSLYDYHANNGQLNSYYDKLNITSVDDYELEPQYKQPFLIEQGIIKKNGEKISSKIKFDDVLEYHVGEFGNYQKLIYTLACIPSICAAYFTLMPVFILGIPEHRCQIPGLPNDTYRIQSSYHEQLVNESVPFIMEDGAYSKCELIDNINTSRTITCDRWVYDESSYITSVSDYNMVCDQEIYVSHFKMVSFLGALVGGFANGVLSDIFGRKTLFLICLATYALETVVLLVAPNFFVFLAMRFLQGASGVGVFMVSFVFVMEFVGPHYRMFAGLFIEIFWCFGELVLVGSAYFIKNWVHLVIILTTPCILLVSYIWILPESPRWLILKGRVKDAEKILKKVAKSNSTKLSEGLIRNIEVETTNINVSGQFRALRRHYTVLIRTLIIIFNRFALQMCYYGINLNPEFLQGDLHVNFTLSAAVEMAAIITVLLFISRLGRKPLYCTSMILCGSAFLVSTIPAYFGSGSQKIWVIVLTMVAKFGVSGAFGVMYVYGCELFPTSIRNSVLGVSMIFELLGAVVSPYVVELGKMIGGRSVDGFPVLVFGSVSITAALLSLVLPETKNRKLPETVEDAANFGSVRSFDVK